MRRTQRFFEELQRRNVLRAGIAYLVLSWLLLQVAELLLSVFDAPDWGMQLVVLALAVGFPIALILSWAYEITTEGIVKTSEVNPALSITKLTGRKIDFVIIGVMAVALVLFAIDRAMWRDGGADVADEVVSIAVLPFVVSSDDIAPFYSQLSVDFSGQLQKHREIRLAAREAVSSLPAGASLAEVATRLGVRFVVTGLIDLLDDGLWLSISVFDAQRTETIYESRIADPGDAITSADAAEEMLAALGFPQEKRRDQEIDRVAYEYYLMAEQAYNDVSSSYDEILALIEKAIEIEPRFARALAAQCRYFLSQYKHRDVLDAFSRAEQSCYRAWTLDGKDQDVLYALGELYVQSGQKEKAIESLAAVLELNPNHYDARIALVESMRNDSPEIAEKEYRRLIREQPGSPGAYSSFQQFLFYEGRYREAAEYAEVAFRLRPGSGTAANLAVDYLLSGQFDRAETLARAQVLAGSSSPTMSNILGSSLFFSGDYAGAAEIYWDAVNEGPDSATALRNYGDAIWNLHGQEAARSTYEKVATLSLQHLAIDPSGLNSLPDIIVAFGSLGDSDGFSKYVSEAVSRDSNDPQMFYAIAVGASRLGDMETARSYAQKARDLGFPPALLNADPDIAKAGLKF